MGVKLNKETSDVIHVSQMKDGQIGELKTGAYIGRIIQKNRKGFLAVGMKTGNGFFEQFDAKVRILKNGETLTITDNE